MSMATEPGTAAPTPSGAPAASSIPARSGHYGPLQLCRSEWTKLRTVRSTIWTLSVTMLAVVGIGAIATAVTAHQWRQGGIVDRINFDPTARSLAGLFLGEICLGVLGVLAVTAEYSSGTIRATLAAAPNRRMVLACKAAVFGAVALVTSEVLTFAAFLLGQQLLKGTTPYATLGEPGVLRAVAGTGLTLTVVALFALALGVIIRHTAGAIAAFVASLLVLPLILQAFPVSIQHGALKYLPLVIAERMAATTSPASDFGNAALFSPWVGFAILCGYTLALLLIGGWLFSRRDA
ncbi:MAG TPA: ABC transporter permease subunit [Acidimicrobiales bacterium]|nr:ABC transporter permease subunit [Acidimicrobiales bacterium]